MRMGEERRERGVSSGVRNKLQVVGGGTGFNDRELQVMAGNAPYLTPPPHLIPSREITPCCIPVNIFLSPRRAPLFRIARRPETPIFTLCSSDRIITLPGHNFAGGDNVPLGLHAYALERDCEGSSQGLNLFARFASLSSVSSPISDRSYRVNFGNKQFLSNSRGERVIRGLIKSVLFFFFFVRF